MSDSKASVTTTVITGVFVVLASTVGAWISSGTKFEKELAAAQQTIKAIESDAIKQSTKLTELNSRIAEASAELGKIRGEIPKLVQPSLNNCKPAEQTPAPSSSTLCGPGFVMVGRESAEPSARTVCCSLGFSK